MNTIIVAIVIFSVARILYYFSDQITETLSEGESFAPKETKL